VMITAATPVCLTCFRKARTALYSRKNKYD
jgi:hypothetical protein